MHNEFNAFYDAIMNNPDDDVVRLVFCDWLDERNHPLGSFIRAQYDIQKIEEEEDCSELIAAVEAIAKGKRKRLSTKMQKKFAKLLALYGIENASWRKIHKHWRTHSNLHIWFSKNRYSRRAELGHYTYSYGLCYCVGGFPSVVVCHLDRWLNTCGELCHFCPIRRVEITDRCPMETMLYGKQVYAYVFRDADMVPTGMSHLEAILPMELKPYLTQGKHLTVDDVNRVFGHGDIVVYNEGVQAIDDLSDAVLQHGRKKAEEFGELTVLFKSKV